MNTTALAEVFPPVSVPLDGAWHPAAAYPVLWVPPGWSLEYDGPMVRAVRDGLVD